MKEKINYIISITTNLKGIKGFVEPLPHKAHLIP